MVRLGVDLISGHAGRAAEPCLFALLGSSPQGADAAVHDATKGRFALGEGFLELGGRRVFALEAGEGPTVLLLHGVTANAYVWLPVMEELAAAYRVVAVDQRGHGRTGPVAGGEYDAAAYAGDVAAVAAALGAGPIVVVGHSLGARNAVVAGSRFPHRVAGVVAIDFTPFIEVEVLDAVEQRVRAGMRSFADEADLRGYLAGRYPRVPPEARERRLRYGYVATGAGVVEGARAGDRGADDGLRPLADPQAMVRTCEGLRDDLAPELAALAVPALVVRGGASAVVSAAALAATARLRPDLEFALVESADHYVPEEQPAEVAALVGAFVERVLPSLANPSGGSGFPQSGA
jgi:2-(acetamidomethylene)succinate hydrolase